MKSDKLLYVLLIISCALFYVLYTHLEQSSTKAGIEQTVQTADIVKETDVAKEADTSLVSIPDISLPLLLAENNFDATELADNSLLPREPYVLNVWGSWCIACAKEHDMLKKMQISGIDVVGINYKDDVDTANDFLTEHGNPFTLVFFDEMGELGSKLGLTGAPESFIVDGEGIVHQHIVGEITEDIWRTRIQPCHEALTANKDMTSIKKMCD